VDVFHGRKSIMSPIKLRDIKAAVPDSRGSYIHTLRADEQSTLLRESDPSLRKLCTALSSLALSDRRGFGGSLVSLVLP